MVRVSEFRGDGLLAGSDGFPDVVTNDRCLARFLWCFFFEVPFFEDRFFEVTVG